MFLRLQLIIQKLNHIQQKYEGYLQGKCYQKDKIQVPAVTFSGLYMAFIYFVI